MGSGRRQDQHSHYDHHDVDSLLEDYEDEDHLDVDIDYDQHDHHDEEDSSAAVMTVNVAPHRETCSRHRKKTCMIAAVIPAFIVLMFVIFGSLNVTGTMM